MNNPCEAGCAGFWHDRPMQESIVSSLLGARQNLRTIWEKQLRSEPIRSPMANPDSLIYLMEWTLNELFARLRDEANGPVVPEGLISRDDSIAAICDCGGNPFLTYFGSARKAVLAWAGSTHSPISDLSGDEKRRCVQELLSALEVVARREIESFCSVCQYQRMDKPLIAEKSSLYPPGSNDFTAVGCEL